MDCREFEDLVGAYVDGELTGKPLHEFESHRRSCSLCALLMDTVLDNRAVFSAIPEVDPPPELARRILEATRRPRFSPLGFLKSLLHPAPILSFHQRRLAAAALACLFLVAVGYNLLNAPVARNLDPTGGSSPVLDNLTNKVVHRFVKLYEGASEAWDSVVIFTEKAQVYLETKWEQVKDIFSPRDKKKETLPRNDKKDPNRSGMERSFPDTIALLGVFPGSFVPERAPCASIPSRALLPGLV
ncbi:MAG: zf-HC2 domain-containing protein [Acidobacteria bacterium]|nr:zf-HC2 domain-containing protein [Acidobacteriota bacterium]